MSCHTINQVATYHFDFKAVKAEQQPGSGTILIEDDGQESDWKLYLVQVSIGNRLDR
jgi:hypothetical protein